MKMEGHKIKEIEEKKRDKKKREKREKDKSDSSSKETKAVSKSKQHTEGGGKNAGKNHNSENDVSKRNNNLDASNPSGSHSLRHTAEEIANTVRRGRKRSEDAGSRRYFPALDVSHDNGRRKFNIVLRDRPFTSMPSLYASPPSRNHVPDEKTKRVPPLRRTNTVTRLIAFKRIAKNMASNLESRKQAIPPKDKISKEYWRKVKSFGKMEARKEMFLPKNITKFVYRTGTTWKLKATAFVGEPGRMDPDYDPLTGRPKKKPVIEPHIEEAEDEDKPLARFRHAVKTVQFLLKATISSRQEGARSEARLLSFAQYQDDLESAPKGALYGAGLTFDPHEFKAIREVQLSVEAKTVLRMEPSERTEEHLRLALVNLQQAVEAFGEFPIQMQRSLVRVGWYEKFQTKRVIIRQGHKAENFYFIISGTAVVTILITNPQTGEQYVRTAAFLGKGNSFGELGLMHGSRRSATVTCKEDVELLTVGREDFIDIFMHIERDKEPDHIQFLKTIDILNGWPIQNIPWDDPKICLFTYFRRGVVMCKDSSQAEWIYFIKTGSCRVLMALKATRPRLTAPAYPSKRTAIKDSPRESLRGTGKNSPEGIKCSKLQQTVTPRRVGVEKEPRSEKKSLGLPPRGAHRRKSKESDGKGDDAAKSDLEHHSAMITGLFEERHPTSSPHEYGPHSEKLSTVEEGDTRKAAPKIVFVQIQKLGPRDTFGVGEAAFSLVQNSMSTSLVSDGAEAVLISRKFFLQHLTDEKRRQLRITLRPYPTEESLQQKLQDQTNWEAFKALTLREHVDYSKYVNDTLHWYDI